MAITRDEFYAQHKCCPNCKTEKVHKTCIPIKEVEGVDFYDDKNKFDCTRCQLTGMVYELVPKE